MQQGLALAIVDLVTICDYNLHADLLELLSQTAPAPGAVTPLCAIAFRCRLDNQKQLFEVWDHPLTLGQPLPTLPLWLTLQLAIPLELEASYEQTCRELRIP